MAKDRKPNRRFFSFLSAGILALTAGLLNLCSGCGCVTHFYLFLDDEFSRGKELSNADIPLTKLPYAGMASQMVFSPDSKHLVVGSKVSGQGWTYVWDLATKKEVHCERFERCIRSLSFHPDGARLLVACSHDYTSFDRRPVPAKVTIVDFPSFRRLVELEVGVKISGQGAKFSPDGKLYAVQKMDSIDADPAQILIYESQTFQQMVEIPGRYSVARTDFNGRDNYSMTAFAFTPSGKYILAGNYSAPKEFRQGNCLEVYRVTTGKPRHRFEEGGTNFQYVGNELRLLGWGPDYHVYDEVMGELVPHKQPEYVQRVGETLYSPDGRYRAFASERRLRRQPPRLKLYLERIEKKELLRIYYDRTNSMAGRFANMAFSPDGKFLAVDHAANVLLFSIPD